MKITTVMKTMKTLTGKISGILALAIILVIK